MEVNSDTDTGATTPEAIDISRELLQQEKLRLEVRELRYWFLRPHALAALATILVAVLGFISAVWLGYFDKARLDFERAQLGSQVATLETSRRETERKVLELLEQKKDLLKSIDDATAERTQAEADLQAVAANASSDRKTLQSSMQQYQEANRRLAERNEALEKQVASFQSRLATATEQLADIRRQMEDVQHQDELLRDQMLLLPPILTEARLIGRSGDPRTRGEVIGANFGERAGEILIRVIRVKRTTLTARRLPETDQNPEILLSFSVPAELVQKWNIRSATFEIPAGDRTKLLELRRTILGKYIDDYPDGLSLSEDAEYQAQVRTILGTETAWRKILVYQSATFVSP